MDAENSLYFEGKSDALVMIGFIFNNTVFVVLDVKGVGGLKQPNVKIKMGSKGQFKADAADSKEDSMNFNSKDKL